jgi:hypothetical protein
LKIFFQALGSCAIALMPIAKGATQRELIGENLSTTGTDLNVVFHIIGLQFR